MQHPSEYCLIFYAQVYVRIEKKHARSTLIDLSLLDVRRQEERLSRIRRVAVRAISLSVYRLVLAKLHSQRSAESQREREEDKAAEP